MPEDTIAAIATPAGVGAIAIIRVSGINAINSVDSIFHGKKNLNDVRSHSVHYGKIFDEFSKLIDDVLVTVFRAPHSYTGEDSVEISTHGNPLILEKILEQLLNKDVRIAEPGEFTKRAFLNGKIDLTQAEAVIDIITSRTEVSLIGARNQLNGLLSQKVNKLRNELINASSFIELELDFAEEDVEFVKRDTLLSIIQSTITELEYLIDSYSYGRVLKDGVNVAIIGAPNVGKSSILNYFLKESRSIVSEIPGTTRDIISEEVSIGGILFKLFDTAGMRKSEDFIENEGISRSIKAMNQADIVLLVFSSDTISDNLLSNHELENKQIIKVLNKIDLGSTDHEDYDILISAKTGDGMSQLMNLLKEKASVRGVFSERTTIVTNIRHYNCLIDAKRSLKNSLQSINSKLSGEFIAQNLRESEVSLNEIIGTVTTDDILNNIFRNFCIGK